MPESTELPARYHGLLDWYKNEYRARNGPADENSDPILRMRGVGKELWRALGGGDAFIARERAAWDEPLGQVEAYADRAHDQSIFQRVWNRIAAHQGRTFHTATKLPFTYELEGDNGLWFYRQGRRINQRLSRLEVEKALSRCPLEKTTDINDLRDYAYLYALLTDRRIREKDW